MTTPAVHDGLIYVADCERTFHCVDAATGKVVWTQEIKGEAWTSPYVADGKVYFGTRGGQFWIFKAGRTKEVLASMELGRPLSATPVAANGVLYVSTMTHLYALQQGTVSVVK
jgi:outer membrane protein assembly factor BamB